MSHPASLYFCVFCLVVKYNDQWSDVLWVPVWNVINRVVQIITQRKGKYWIHRFRRGGGGGAWHTDLCIKYIFSLSPIYRESHFMNPCRWHCFYLKKMYSIVQCYDIFCKIWLWYLCIIWVWILQGYIMSAEIIDLFMNIAGVNIFCWNHIFSPPPQ